MEKKCPKRYGSFDVMIANCEKCRQGKLYQVCTCGKDHLACAGWLDEDGRPHCCEHYPEEKENVG